MRPNITRIVRVGAGDVLDDIGSDIELPGAPVNRFIERRTQRFATEVNQTTWIRLRASLSQGIDDGDSQPAMAQRVRDIMGTRIQSDAATIARTETLGAYNGGGLIAAEEAGARTKEWSTALDGDRVRSTHQAVHGKRVAIGADFNVGGASGPAPGQLGSAKEDINCRCSLRYRV